MELEFKDGYMNFSLPSEAADDMVQQYLRHLALGLNEQIKELKSKELSKLANYEKEDLVDSYSYRDSTIKVLEYISLDSEHKQWLRDNNLNC